MKLKQLNIVSISQVISTTRIHSFLFSYRTAFLLLFSTLSLFTYMCIWLVRFHLWEGICSFLQPEVLWSHLRLRIRSLSVFHQILWLHFSSKLNSTNMWCVYVCVCVCPKYFFIHSLLEPAGKTAQATVLGLPVWRAVLQSCGRTCFLKPPVIVVFLFFYYLFKTGFLCVALTVLELAL